MSATTVVVAGAVVAGAIAFAGWRAWGGAYENRTEAVRASGERASGAAAAAGDDEQVRFWLDKVAAKTKADGKLEMPSPREIALRMQLSECTEHVPCGERVLNVMGRIAEGVAEKAEIKNVRDAEDYWSLRIMLGYPVPTAQEVLARGVGPHPCLSRAPPCESEIKDLLGLLRAIQASGKKQAIAAYNDAELNLRRQFVEDWKAGVASKKVPEGLDVKKAAYMVLCKEKVLRGIDCDANYAALQNSIRKELGLPTVGIAPGTTRVAGVPDQGTDLNDPKLDAVTFYPPVDPSDMIGHAVAIETTERPALNKMQEDQKASEHSFFDALRIPQETFASPASFDRLLSVALA